MNELIPVSVLGVFELKLSVRDLVTSGKAFCRDEFTAKSLVILAISRRLMEKLVAHCLEAFVKYFFLSDGWTIGRVWELGGLWNEVAWRRKPEIQRLKICILEKGQKLWLYRVEDAVLMVEVMPTQAADIDPASQSIGQVVLKRLMSPDQAIDLLCTGIYSQDIGE